MVKFESSDKTVNASVEKVHTFLSDFTNFGPLVPQERVTDWTCDSQTCRFVIKGIGEAGLKIVETIPYNEIKYISNGKVPFNFYLWVYQQPISETTSTLKLVVDADLNPMMKILASQHLEKFIEVLANAFAQHQY